MNIRLVAIGASLGMAFTVVQVARAGVSAEEAAKLKTTLTPLGAERAGNQGGTIPEWRGGLTGGQPPKSGTRRSDPFANDRPIYSVSAQNVAQHKDKLSEGQLAMFQKYPNYRIDVYSTNRSAAAPQWIYDNTFKNATRAKLSNAGNSVEGAYGGIPFPIPKTGAEAMWNHLLTWQGESLYYDLRVYVTSADGKRYMSSDNEYTLQMPYYYREGTLETFKGEVSWAHFKTVGPPQRVGEIILVRDPIDFAGPGRQAWQYLTGQRRVRKAPGFAFDTPTTSTSGQANFDEINVFNGALDRYDWKLVGKKEMLLPYNNNRFLQPPKDSEVLGERFLNPDHVRWELHRVWVVEGTLVAGKRHVLPKRRFYLDEDTWLAMLADSWDARGQLSKTYWYLNVAAPDLPGVVGVPFGHYDLQTGGWVATNIVNEKTNQLTFPKRLPEAFFTPDAMAGTGVR